MSLNPHYPTIFLLFFALLCNTHAIPINNKSNDLEKRHVSYSKVENHIMYGFDLVILQLGIVCTLYMIIRTFIRWFKHDLSLHMSHKLPFYMALSDFFIYVALTVNLYYPAVNDSVQWPDQSCKIVALSFYYFALFNMILVGSLAVVSYFRVCKAMTIDTGILDYKLFIFPIFIPAILCIPALRYFGADGYWCFQNRKSSLIPLVLLYAEIFILLTSLFCYIGISHAINVSRFRNDEENFRTSNKKIVSYIFMYILQWTPVMVYIIIGIEHPANMWIFVICIISLPVGGILNTYRYVSNEGWWNVDSDIGVGQDPSPRNRSNLHSVKNYGGPPTVSQWRELSGEDVEDHENQQSSDQLQDQIQIEDQLQNESQDQDQDQIQVKDQLQNEPQDQIQIQLQNDESQSQRLPSGSQDQIQIQLQNDESQSQQLPSGSQEIQLQEIQVQK